MKSDATDTHPYAKKEVEKQIKDLIQMHLEQIGIQEASAAELSIHAGEQFKQGQELETGYGTLKIQFQEALDSLDKDTALEIFLIILMLSIIIALSVAIVYIYKK